MDTILARANPKLAGRIPRICRTAAKWYRDADALDRVDFETVKYLGTR